MKILWSTLSVQQVYLHCRVMLSQMAPTSTGSCLAKARELSIDRFGNRRLWRMDYSFWWAMLGTDWHPRAHCQSEGATIGCYSWSWWSWREKVRRILLWKLLWCRGREWMLTCMWRRRTSDEKKSSMDNPQQIRAISSFRERARWDVIFMPMWRSWHPGELSYPAWKANNLDKLGANGKGRRPKAVSIRRARKIPQIWNLTHKIHGVQLSPDHPAALRKTNG